MPRPFRRFERACARLAVAAAGVLFSAAATAAQIGISPLMLSLGPDQRATTLSLHNEAATPVSVQVRVFGWRQDLEAGMLLDPTGDVAFAPALVTLAPGVTQLIRFQIPSQDVRSERYYRVLVDELPDPADASRNAVQVLTRYSLPLFVEPRLQGVPHLLLSRRACSDGDPRDYLVVSNDGKKRARLGNWKVEAGGKTLAAQDGLAGYALPGSGITLPLPEDLTWPAGTATLIVDTDVGPWRADIPQTREAGVCASPSSPR